MFLDFALLLVFVVLAAVVTWVTYGQRRTRFLPDFETLLERPEFVSGFGGRSLLKGEFRGRNVSILVQHADDEPTLVVSVEVRASLAWDTYDFAGYKGDREGELALFALEVKHELTLRHVDGYLKAQWQPLGLFPGSGDRSKWRSVLEALDTLAGSIERRASSPTVSAAR
jgi:hypothetical protein